MVELALSSEEVAALLQSTMANAPVGMGFLDRALRWVLVNEPLARMSGAPVEAHIGRGVSEVHAALGGALEVLFARARDSQVPVVDQALGGWLVSAFPVRLEEGPSFGVGVVVVELSEQLRPRAEAQAAVRARDELVAIASHDVKTPLTAALLQAQTALRHADQVVRPRLEKVCAQVHRAITLLDDLLSVSRASFKGTDLKRESVDLVALVRELVQRHREAIEGAGSPVRIDAPGALVGRWDRLRLEQILANLLTNALKYGAHQPIEITVSRRGDLAAVCVRDHGIGISQADQRRIFRRFERATEEGGAASAGLGLWIVRRLVGAFGGRVQVESEPGQGAAFTVELPLGQPVSEAVPDAPPRL